jgi:hypothetical protein
MMQLCFDLARPADDAAIRRLLRRQAVPGRVSVTFEREPEFWKGCAVTGMDSQVLVARTVAAGEIVGVACRSVRDVFVNGRPLRLGYLGQLRVDERFRGRWMMSRGFSLLHRLHEEDPVPAYLTSIIGGNSEATGVLVHRPRRLFPKFHPVAHYSTLALDLRRRKAPLACDASIVAGDPDSVDEIVSFLQTHGARRQFFPIWTAARLRDLAGFGLGIEDLRIARRDHEIVGVMGLWDQTAYKQTVVQGYSGWLKAAAPLWNSSAALFGRNALPRPGEELRSAYASLICVANDDTAVFAGLLREIYNLAASRGFSHLLLGLDARDPLLRVARDYAHVLYPSRFYLAAWPDGGHLHEQLDHRSTGVDAASL